MQEKQPINRQKVLIGAAILLLFLVAIGVVRGLLGMGGRQPAPAAPVAIGTVVPSPPATMTAAPTLTSNPPPPATPVSGDSSIGDVYTPELGNTGYQVQQYALSLALDPATPFVAGTATIDAVTTVDNLGRLSLDFIGFTIESVTVDGTAATYEREGDKLFIELPQPPAPGNPFSMVVAYSGEAVQRPSAYLGFVAHLGLTYPGRDTLFVIAQPDGARFWFPANDHPRDKATFRFEYTVPQGLTAVANGRLVAVRQGETMPDGRPADTFVWEHNYPMATYLALAAVGPYERLDGLSGEGVPLRDYVFPELQREFLRATAVTAEAMTWMSDLFGPYPFEAYGHATVYVPNVSMETQTMVLLSHRMMTEGTVIHELAHAWFGNWVSLDSWADMWRNEGFATYVTLLWETRDDPEALELHMAALETAVAEQQSPHPLNDLPPELLFSFDSYIKGAVVVHNLRLAMGDDAFFSGLRTYFERFGGGTASHADFQTVMEEAAGFSLDDFFSRWFAGH
jgi:aminopeptidase N